jgi:hypothetical protein
MHNGFNVRIGSTEVVYLTPDSEVAEADPTPVGYDFFEDLAIRRHPRFRRVLISFIKPIPLYFGMLHWSDGTNLSHLDDQVRSGDPEAVGLKTGLFVQSRSLTCRACQAGLRLAVPDTGHPLVTTQLLRSHSWVRDCPVCAKPLGLLVAEVL